jgi:hypothetical protein
LNNRTPAAKRASLAGWLIRAGVLQELNRVAVGVGYHRNRDARTSLGDGYGRFDALRLELRDEGPDMKRPYLRGATGVVVIDLHGEKLEHAVGANGRSGTSAAAGIRMISLLLSNFKPMHSFTFADLQ